MRSLDSEWHRSVFMRWVSFCHLTRALKVMEGKPFFILYETPGGRGVAAFALDSTLVPVFLCCCKLFSRMNAESCCNVGVQWMTVARKWIPVGASIVHGSRNVCYGCIAERTEWSCCCCWSLARYGGLLCISTIRYEMRAIGYAGLSSLQFL